MHETFSPRLFKFALLALAGVIVVGTVGYRLIVHEDWISSFYRVIVTVSLTGLDSRPPGHAAELFTVALLFFGVAFFAYVAGAIVDVIARGIWGDVWSQRRRRHAIEELRDHFIICGYGRVGRRVAEELRASGVPYVVLDFNEKVLAVAKEQNELYVVGNGTEDARPRRRGARPRARARGRVRLRLGQPLHHALGPGSARPDLLIVARASDEEAEKKLMLAGADRVALPYAIAGRTMANYAAKPQVAAFLQVVLDLERRRPPDRGDRGHRRRRYSRAARSASWRSRDRTGATIVAVSKAGGDLMTRPGAQTVLEAGDVLVGVGTADGDPRARRAVRTAEGRCLLGRSTVSPPGSDRLQARRSCSSAPATRSTATTRRTSRCGWRPSAAGRRASSPRSWRRRPRGFRAWSAPRSPGRAS